MNDARSVSFTVCVVGRNESNKWREEKFAIMEVFRCDFDDLEA